MIDFLVGILPMVCLVGDGSSLYSPQALWTAAHERVPVTLLRRSTAAAEQTGSSAWTSQTPRSILWDLLRRSVCRRGAYFPGRFYLSSSDGTAGASAAHDRIVLYVAPGATQSLE